ncbi:hypothetical protein KGF56_002580 [Candida oxycetoniae]|uniref:Major facilitator superfamily (MFS) profile domain-containing protein n=1 Tax=Candida oxycetoniae TaxID=497107 RepID=A0AAI9WY40_9ASCO|nr:uncharacterized protein KGF56_002580 [Candida oxycetoniae]KAI3404635.2 hypothetical protein KGF56_002580 [Candida oxycetoniae]
MLKNQLQEEVHVATSTRDGEDDDEDDEDSVTPDTSTYTSDFEFEQIDTTKEEQQSQQQSQSQLQRLHTLDDPAKFPNAWNLKAMLTLLGSFIGLIGSLGFVNTAGVISTYLSENTLKGESQTTISWIFSLYNFFAFGGCLISGVVFDRFGCRIPVFCGGIAMFLGLLCTSFCYKVWQFILAYGVLAGFGAAFTFGPFIAVLSHWFLSKRALAVGAAYTGGGVGGVIFPLIFRALFPKVGFGWTIRVGAFISLFFLLLGWALVSDRNKEFAEYTEDNIFKQIYDSIDFRIMIKNPLFTVIVTGLLFNGIAFLITLVELPTYSTMRGFSESESYLLIVVFNSFSIPGRIIPSFAADHGFGRFNTFCVINVLSLISFCVIWVPFGHWLKALFVFAGCFGFTSGSVLSLSASLVSSIVKTADVGKGLGTAFFILSLGDLFGLPIASAFINENPESYDHLVYFLTSCAFVGACVSFVSRYMYGGFNLKPV